MENVYGPKKLGEGMHIINAEDHPLDDDFGSGYKTCKVCDREKPLVEYRVEAKGVQGRKAICKSCSSPIPPKAQKIVVSEDRIQKALEAAAYRIIQESM